ncbi:MAG TPA: bifunctional ornithine acetyltransferase/N-acetylglutamate synthase [Gammaproteobacteria bacterium]|nr:bifunctional ornithine acetyltransferase/N-acetylglutamate synthase [Gammaproteobacteria bacterium]
MAVNLSAPRDVLDVPGIRLGTAASGLKASDDVVVAHLDPQARVAGVYTQSSFAAAPVLLARERQENCQAWVINSGNANAATGEPGKQDAHIICESTAELLGIDVGQVQPFSTGVIGERLDVPALTRAVASAAATLRSDGWLSAANAIMTTDTVPKLVSKRIALSTGEIVVTGMAKGSGMIKPDMATMLAFVACNANISPPLLKQLTTDLANQSFNRISVDGDTSTNDCFMLAATGCSDTDEIKTTEDKNYPPLLDGLAAVAQQLAQAIVRDGEGATKFVTVQVTGGASPQECLEVAYTVAESPLVKTALFAGDANWGRFCMAIGRAKVAGLDASKVALWLDGVQVANAGLMSATYTEAAGSAVLAQDEFKVTIDLGRGDAEEQIWTTDLSYEYVRINAEYRS